MSVFTEHGMENYYMSTFVPTSGTKCVKQCNWSAKAIKLHSINGEDNSFHFVNLDVIRHISRK